MSDYQTNSHGGYRPGAGRKHGTGKFGEPTESIRVPISLVPIVKAWLAAKRAVLPKHARFVGSLLQGQAFPLFSSKVPAGLPSPADDHLEDTLDLNEHLIQHPAATFFVRVQGESMTGAGIHDGDLLVVDRAREPRSGNIVVAVINGELTVKRLMLEQGKLFLMPENPAFPPLEILENMDWVIWGVVAHAVHSFYSHNAQK